jgi:osmoprotectant transport system substrate-binding protein
MQGDGFRHARRVAPVRRGGRVVIALALAVTAALAVVACGQSFAPTTTHVAMPSGRPGTGKPPVVIGDKNFTEELILGQLYAQALRA